MRKAEYERSLAKLQKQHRDDQPDARSLSDGVEIDFSQPCVVVGGRNGAGKSRFLRGISEQDGIRGVLVDLHHLAEQALIILRSREDFDAMVEEYTPLNLSDDTLSAIGAIVGRDYASVEWYSLEVEPPDAQIANRFKWGGEQCLVPYFRVSHKGQYYTARDMGLGEFCIHFLLWIVEQYRESKSLTLLLDEPDAYLPPVGVSTLLYHVAAICLKNEWKVVLSTHSEEMIRIARDNSCFMLLRVDEAGITTSVHSSQDPSAGDSLLGLSGIRRLFFCEDESATALLDAIILIEGPASLRRTSVIWGDGDGYLRKLQATIPKPPQPDIEFAYVFDGDQRARDVPLSTARQWPAVYLPTSSDPDDLFKSLASNPDELAVALGAPLSQLREFLGSLEGADPHDWVNGLCDRFGRGHTLRSLASLWCRLNPTDVETFIGDLNGSSAG